MLHSRTSRGGFWPAVGGFAALGFAVLSLSGFAIGRVLGQLGMPVRPGPSGSGICRHSHGSRPPNARGLGHVTFDGKTAARMSHVLSGLERSTPNNARLDALVDPTMAAVSLARQGRPKAAKAKFAQVSKAATTAAVTEAAVDPGAHVGLIARLQEQAAAIAAVLGSLIGLLLIIARPRRRDTRDRTVEALTEQARTDNLTGSAITARSSGDLSLRSQRRTSTGVTVLVLAIDLDGLKQINDTKGHTSRATAGSSRSPTAIRRSSAPRRRPSHRRRRVHGHPPGSAQLARAGARAADRQEARTMWPPGGASSHRPLGVDRERKRAR